MPLPDPTTAPPGWPEAMVPLDNREMAKWLAVTSDANRDYFFQHRQDTANQAEQCWIGGHEDTIALLRSQLAQARGRVAFLEEHYRASLEHYRPRTVTS